MTANLQRREGKRFIVFIETAWLKREGERFIISIQPAWRMRTTPYSALGPLKQGHQAKADRVLVPVLHEELHATCSIPPEQGWKLSRDVATKGPIKWTKKLVAQGLCIFATSALAEVAWEGWPGRPILPSG